jgi:hypothetical protein
MKLIILVKVMRKCWRVVQVKRFGSSVIATLLSSKAFIYRAGKWVMILRSDAFPLGHDSGSRILSSSVVSPLPPSLPQAYPKPVPSPSRGQKGQAGGLLESGISSPATGASAATGPNCAARESTSRRILVTATSPRLGSSASEKYPCVSRAGFASRGEEAKREPDRVGARARVRAREGGNSDRRPRNRATQSDASSLSLSPSFSLSLSLGLALALGRASCQAYKSPCSAARPASGKYTYAACQSQS